ncbi:hypothetical protein DFH29DRAFT_521397, partial [Suillus ampliporus]
VLGLFHQYCLCLLNVSILRVSSKSHYLQYCCLIFLYIIILGDFSAGVFIDNKELPEYDVIISATDSENRTTCWIPSEAGKKFEVRGEIIAPQSSGIISSVTVDGVCTSPHILVPRWIGTIEFTCLNNVHISRDLMFSNIELTDDDSMLDDENSDEIGQIVLEVQTGKCRKASKAQVGKFDKANNHTLRVGEGKVHERSKKARAHRVAFGEEVPCEDEPLYYNFTPDNSPATVFVFKYTRLDILQAMGVAPSAPIREDTKDYGDKIQVIDRPSDPLPKDVKPRIQQLEMELQHLRAQLASSSSSEDRKPSLVKLERGESRRQHATIEVIDLTED